MLNDTEWKVAEIQLRIEPPTSTIETLKNAKGKTLTGYVLEKEASSMHFKLNSVKEQCKTAKEFGNRVWTGLGETIRDSTVEVLLPLKTGLVGAWREVAKAFLGIKFFKLPLFPGSMIRIRRCSSSGIRSSGSDQSYVNFIKISSYLKFYKSFLGGRRRTLAAQTLCDHLVGRAGAGHMLCARCAVKLSTRNVQQLGRSPCYGVGAVVDGGPTTMMT
ncbi:hypothetical protein F511_06982 [Dorcoceras hygrometricum]|uniref:Uncharacterized protein n=1 Tax=Dorcoceras hygrometricum TaxID=472368 RepID=A0A2Z7D2F5_9LAMI|nr:hypothetical protein F511_06982 [Dorcoceras hygrometricum]